MLVCIFTILWTAEVHGVARSTSSYPSRLPALGHKLWLKIFYHYKVYPLNLESLNQTKTIPVVLPSSQIEIWGKTVKRLELWSDLDKLNKDKNIQFLFYRYSMIRKKNIKIKISTKLPEVLYIQGVDSLTNCFYLLVQLLNHIESHCSMLLKCHRKMKDIHWNFKSKSNLNVVLVRPKLYTKLCFLRLWFD